MSTEPWVVRQKIEIPFQYTTGPALERFFQGLREGILWASVCAGCGRRSLPPVSFCARCWRNVEEFARVSERGRLVSFTVVPRPVAELPEAGPPVGYGLVSLEGADDCLVHLVHAGRSGVLAVGVPVEAVWRQERSGSILDLQHFRVLE